MGRLRLALRGMPQQRLVKKVAANVFRQVFNLCRFVNTLLITGCSYQQGWHVPSVERLVMVFLGHAAISASRPTNHGLFFTHR